jgi:ornithine decarboxylase
MVATAATLVVEIIGKAVRNGKQCYYVNDGVYGTFSGVLFDHCQYHFKSFKKGPTQIASVFGPTCDALDVVSVAEDLPVNLQLGDLLYSEKSAPTPSPAAPISTACRCPRSWRSARSRKTDRKIATYT